MFSDAYIPGSPPANLKKNVDNFSLDTFWLNELIDVNPTSTLIGSKIPRIHNPDIEPNTIE